MSTPQPAKNVGVVVVGAGVSGLTCALRLALAGAGPVTLVEAADHAGGVVRTAQQDGYLLELGPNSFSNRPTAAMEVIQEIGLGPRALVQPMRQHDRYVWKAGQLWKVPTAPPALLFSGLLSRGDKLRMLTGFF